MSGPTCSSLVEVDFLDLFPKFFAERCAIVGQSLERDTLAENAKHAIRKPADIPILGVYVRSAGTVELGDQDVLDQLKNLLGHILAREHAATQIVDGLALLVHDVVVFQKVFANFEVLPFDPFLGAFDGSGHPGVLYGNALLHPQLSHQAFKPIGAENAQQIVFKR